MGNTTEREREDAKVGKQVDKNEREALMGKQGKIRDSRDDFL